MFGLGLWGFAAGRSLDVCQFALDRFNFVPDGCQFLNQSAVIRFANCRNKPVGLPI